VVLWKQFGEEILDFDQVMRMGKSDVTVHMRLPARPGGLSVASARTVRAAPAAAPMPSSLLVWVFILSYNCSNLLILIQIYDF
jgi:hypothetical protein